MVVVHSCFVFTFDFDCCFFRFFFFLTFFGGSWFGFFWGGVEFAVVLFCFVWSLMLGFTLRL